MAVQPQSFIRFLYPFIFATDTCDARAALVAAGPGDPHTKFWDNEHFPAEELLPYIADYLNPQTKTPPTAYCWRMSDGAFKRWTGHGAEWCLSLHKGSLPTTIPFVFESVRLALFRGGVGLLAVDAKPTDDSMDSWFDFLHYFRFAGGHRGVHLLGKRAVPPEHSQHAQPFQFTGTLGQRIAELLNPLQLQGENGQWWKDIFVTGQLIPFFGLFADKIPTGDFATMAYRARNFFHSKQEMHPSNYDLSPQNPLLLEYADNQSFVFSLEGGGFLAGVTPSTPFFQETLPGHLRREYALLFMLALHQRFALTQLLLRVSAHWLHADEHQRLCEFERSRNIMLEFTARGYFTHVMQREHHHRCYSKWRETFQVEKLYEQVSSTIREMHSHLDLRQAEQMRQVVEQQEGQAKRLERRISAIALLLVMPSLALNVAGAVHQLHWQLTTGALVTGLALGWLVLLVLNRIRDRPAKPNPRQDNHPKPEGKGGGRLCE